MATQCLYIIFFPEGNFFSKDLRIFVLMNKSNAEALPKAGKGWMMENSFYSRHTLTDDEYEVFLFIKNFLFYFINICNNAGFYR